jgi:hypothetical protein
MTPEDRDLIIKTVLGEADDQPDRGKAAVAHAILNRVADGRWGDTPSKVVLARGQFEPWSTRAAELSNIDPQSRKYQRTGAIVDDVIGGKIPDETGGATHFLDPVMVRKRRGGSLPDWASEDGATVSIGDHRFYRPKEMGGQQAISAALKGGAAQPGLPPGATAFDQPDDLVAEWGGGHQAAPLKGRPPQDEDLVGEWATKAAPAEVPAAAPAAAAAKPPEAAGPETLPKRVARMARESQGHGERNLSDLVTGAQRDSWGDTAGQVGAGLVRGVGDVADTLAQGIALGGDKGAGLLSRFGVISPESAKKVTDWRAGVNKAIEADRAEWDTSTGGRMVPEWSRVGGQVAATAPLLAAGGGALAAATRGAPIASTIASRPIIAGALRGAGEGAGAAALTSAASDEPLSKQMTDAATAGGIVGTAGRVAGKLFGKTAGLDRETADLADKAVNKYGIPLRGDQLSSNLLVKHAGSIAQHLPFTGLGEHAAEQQGAFNRAIAREMGESSDKVTGRVVKDALRRSGTMMDDVARRTGSIAVDRPFINEAMRIVTDAQGVLGKESKPIFNQLTNIADRIHGGTIDAEAYQKIIGRGSQFDIALRKHPNGAMREYIGQLKNAVNDMMERSAPADAVADLKTARYQYAIAKTVEPLAKKASTGDISPALLLSKTKGGNLEELGQIGQRFLKPPPSSGTSEKLAFMHLAGKLAAGAAGAGGLGAAAYFDPEHFQQEAGLAAGGLGLAALGGAALKSKIPANRIIRAAQRPNPPPRINIGAPAVALSSRRANALSRATSP